MQLNVFQILLRVQFSLLGGFGVQSQHFVLKIFSESQSEQQGIELGIFNSISDKEKANKSNIIAVYGPQMNADNSDLIRFLESLIEKSKTCAALKDVIEKNYIGCTGGIRDKIETPRCKYIMMNYCNELSLTELIKTRRLTLDLAKDLAKDLAQALEYLHEVNEPTIVHCDVKPDNIFVKSRKKTSFILGDFGFAERYENQTFTLRGSTPSYVPPEWYLGHLDTQISDTADPLELQLRNDRVSELQKRLFRERSERPCKIDIYSYGLIIWLALHNKTEPWTEESSSDWKQYLHDHNQNQNKHRNRSSKEIFLRNLFNDPDKFGTRPTCREDTVLNNNPESKLLFELAKDCWQVDSGLRPSSSEILQKDLFRGKSRRYHNQDIIV